MSLVCFLNRYMIVNCYLHQHYHHPAFGTVFVDQSYWQSSVAAKPKEGVFGFLLGGLCWFAIPFAFASTTGLGYIALSAQQGTVFM
jgi:hypothetical protein